MFESHSNTLTTMIPLCRPQMAILDYEKSHSTISCVKIAAVVHLRTKCEKERGDSHGEPRHKKENTKPGLGARLA